MAKKSTPVEKPAPRSNRDKAVGDDEAKASKARTASKRVAARKSTARADAAGSVNGKNLIIVESPAKARTIERYLGSDFRVMASVGHVIDLPPTRLGVDPEHDFQPEYVIIKGKKTVLDNLKKSARAARAVYLAPDPDREGEAIAHHIAEYIRDANSEIHRATFNEITKTAVRSAIEHPRPINVNLFNAQQARRVLDRLVGYKLSPLLWKKVRRGLSAGRVQSVAVRICCDREREIRAFKSEEYWTIEGLVSAKLPPPFKIRLDKIDGEKAEVPNEEAANRIVAEVRGKELEVGDVIKKEVAKRPFPPFITSTLQQEASRKLRMTAARTMSLAQRLYEGVELGDQGSVALITYMRTDSTRLSDDALTQIRGHIRETYGPDYLPERPRAYAARKEAQEAHEAIRPTDISMTPERVAPYLEKPLLALYTLIWKRAVASQIVDARLERTRIEIPVGRYLFIATGSVIKFDGFLIAYQESTDESGKSESDLDGGEKIQLEEDETLPAVEAGDALELSELGGLQHFTQPPPRYTEAGLIRELERQGIGRPSSYASIISVIQDKEYVTKENGTFRPTDLGFMITDLLTESFPQIMDVKFTAMMEDQLDRVEDGSVDWVELLRNFYGPFSQRLEQAQSQMRNVKAEVVPTEHVCDKCGSPMVVRWGRNGKFLACSAFPACRNTKPIEETAEGEIKVLEAEKSDVKCPECGREMLVKSGRRGRFLACSGYPECKATLPYPIGIACPKCGQGELVERRSGRGKTFYSCNRYPDCKYSVFERPYKERCEACEREHFFVGQGGRKKVLCCERDQCRYEVYEPPAMRAKAETGARRKSEE